MYFLGQAANLRGVATWRHTFAFGTKKDSEALKKHLAKRYNTSVDNVILYHTGRTALAGALLAVLSKNASEKPAVLVTALTCYAVIEAVRAAGAEPVFADVDPITLHFNAETLESALKLHKNIKAIVIQNNLGHPCDIKGIEKLAKKHQIPIIEDLAHCAGISYADGREAGTVGDAVALSFGKGKSIDTTSGGALILRRQTPFFSATGVPRARRHGSRAPTSSVVTSGVCQEEGVCPLRAPRLPDRLRDRFYPLLAALIRALYRVKLGRLFTSLLLKLHFIQRSADAPLDFSRRLTHWQAKLALKQLKSLPENRPPLREFFFVRQREKCLKDLEKAGFIMSDTWYDTPVAPERYFHKSGFKPEECPVATRLAVEIVNLPTFYPRPKLQSARKIIEKYLIKETSDD